MKRFDQINVIPFIDIMLVLLAIVLTTATFIAQEKISIELPEAENTSAQNDKDPIKIAIDKDGKYYYLEALVGFDILKDKLSTLKPDDPIILSVDKSVRFERFIEMIDALKTHNLNNLSIATHQGS
jgi:biopolymer transport protein ExbD